MQSFKCAFEYQHISIKTFRFTQIGKHMLHIPKLFCSCLKTLENNRKPHLTTVSIGQCLPIAFQDRTIHIHAYSDRIPTPC